ncbi:hypothetical protein RIF29_26159 [Crotalaria pallida]|uniref:LOB domain-containing protein n=1 Tax=Crotalaria pallida TaxID=3830 RepID=A0AAN9HXY1_CROPI
MSMTSSKSVGSEESNNGGRSTGGGRGGGVPCGACKFLRRKCLPECIFAPYFDREQGAKHFAAVHKVFGASNVSKLLLKIPSNHRPDAVMTICCEAQARLRDPIYGCFSHMFTLQQQVTTLKNEISYLQAQLVELPQPLPPLQQVAMAAAMPATFDLSTLFDSMAQSPWTMMQQRAMDPQYQYVSGGTSASGSGGTGSGGGDNSNLHALASELMPSHGPAPVAPGVDANANANDASPSHPHH